MVYSNLWQGRTGRLPYLVAFVISSAAIAVLPFVAGKITIASAGGMDPRSQEVSGVILRPSPRLNRLLLHCGSSMRLLTGLGQRRKCT